MMTAKERNEIAEELSKAKDWKQFAMENREMKKKNKVFDIKLKNIVGMATAYPAMTRIFESGSMEKIKPKVEECLRSLKDVKTKSAFDKCHEEFCRWFVCSILQTKSWKSASWGQASKVLDVALKVCVYYCSLPSQEISQRVLPWLNPAIDTPLLIDLKKRYGNFQGILSLADIDRERYEILQKIIKVDMKRYGNVLPVEYDDIRWRELNRKD